MEQKKRMISQDIAKAIVILSVVITHTLGMRDNIFHPLSLYMFLIMCPMGFFFFISGYNYHPGKRTAKESIWIRFKQLMFPLFTYTAFFCVIAVILNLTTGFSSIVNIAKAGYISITGCAFEKSILFNYILKEADPVFATAAFTIPSWFIVYMFFGYVLFFLIVDFAMKDTKRLISICTLLVFISMVLFHFLNGVANPLGIINAPFIACLLLVGCYFGSKKFLDTETYGKKWTIINSVVSGVICLTIALIAPRACLMPGGLLGIRFDIAEIPLSVFVSILYTYALINFCKLLENIPVITNGLLWIGRNSLRIFLLHMPISKFVCYYTGFTSSAEQTVGEFFALFGITLGITLVLTIIIDISKKFILKKIAEKKTAKLNNETVEEGK